MYGSGKYSRKRIILTVLSMAVMVGPMFAFMYHLSDPNEPLFLPLHVLLFVSVLLAIVGSFLIVDKSKNLQLSIFIVELIAIIAGTLYVEPSEVVQVIAVFTGAYWGAIKYLKMDFFETNKDVTNTNEKKVDS